VHSFSFIVGNQLKENDSANLSHQKKFQVLLKNSLERVRRIVQRFWEQWEVKTKQ